MKIQFEINYKTSWGQQLFISGSLAALGKWESKNAASMQYVGSSGDAIGKWVLEIEIPQKKVKDFSYKYFVREEQTQKEDWEWGENRAVFLASKKLKTLEIKDFWRPQQELQNIFFTSAFTKSLMKRNNSTAVVKSTIFEENPIPKIFLPK